MWRSSTQTDIEKRAGRRQYGLTTPVFLKEYDFSKAKRGPVVPSSKGKTRITIRLDDDLVQWFKAQVHNAGGGNYQTLMNHALRDYMISSDKPLEEVLRRVLR